MPLRLYLRSVEKDFDYIIIDTPPSIGVALKNVLAMADYIVIPVEESGWALDGLMDFAHAIELAQDNNEKLSVAGILTIKAKANTKKSSRMADLASSIAEKLGSTRFETMIRESVACAEALTEYYVPLHEYAPKGNTTLDYREFVNELEARING